jgi:hypothetical protein
VEASRELLIMANPPERKPFSRDDFLYMKHEEIDGYSDFAAIKKSLL